MVDYGLARRATLASVRSGRTTIADVCDAHPYLLRAAKFHGEPTEDRCPICRKAKLTHVTYVYGDELGQYEGRVKQARELRKWRPNTANSGSMWSRSVRVAGGTTSLPLTFSALASQPYAGGGVRGPASKQGLQEVAFVFGGFPECARLSSRGRNPTSRGPRATSEDA